MCKLLTVTLRGLLGVGMTIAAMAPVTAQPIFDSLRLSSGFRPDPQTLRGVSGGSYKAMELLSVRETPTGACVGYIDEYADHQLKLDSFFNYLRVSVESQGDTVLVVKGPGGTWCNDDSNNQNPVIVGEWQSGSYDVWVGSRQKNDYFPYVLEITQVK